MLQVDKSLLRQRMPKNAAVARREYQGPALFSYGFRPFFLFGAVWAALAVPFWIYAYATGVAAIGGTPAQEWHVHEMLFGYLGAIVAGFLLTAVPNWTGRLPVMGAPLMALFGLWVAGRIAMLAYGEIGLAAPVIDSAFLVVLAFIMWREVVAGRNVKNAPICILASLLALANVGFHLGFLEYEWHEVSEHVAIGVISLLIALIGGRIVPSFTRNWMAQKGMTPLPAEFDWIDKASLATAVLAVALWAFQSPNAVSGSVFLVAGALHAIRLARWKGWRTTSEALVFILHVGYAWLPIAFLLMGLAALAPAAVPPYAALHALTAGAMGTMTLAVMTRASLGHTGREKTADVWTIAIYALVVSGALLRVFASIFFVEVYVAALAVAACLWSAAYALFVVRYGPMLFTRRVAG